MLKILINSYTCCPDMGSEQGMGWNWITALAKHCEIYVISEGEYREQCEEASKDLPIHWYWNPVPQATRDKCWNQGNWSFYPLYKKWQKKTAAIARQIIEDVQKDGERIDILHQLNMIGFREPGYLHEVSKEYNIPLVWGPVDAKGSFPMAFADEASQKIKTFLRIKNLLNWMQLKWMPRAHAVAKQSSVVISASGNSQDSFKRYFDVDSILINETGCSAINSINDEILPRFSDGCLNVLWVGKMDFRKQMSLALEALANIKHLNVKLNIVGGGEKSKYLQKAKDLGINDLVFWHGVITHDDVQKMMHHSDILLFTSVAEGTPHVVLEAIANGLPVVCHDICGHGDVITDYNKYSAGVGVKIPLSTPKQSITDFANVITDLYQHREKLVAMSDNCQQRALELSWENKAKQMLNLYEKVVKDKPLS